MSDLPFEEQLRNERNLLWNDCALAARTNSRSPKDICTTWSLAADKLLTKAFQQCFQKDEIALFALGKLGSLELNLSSDVDILLVCQEYSSTLASSLRSFQRTLNDRTFSGFVFRLDFDLRPGGKQGPLLPTIEQLKDYYGNYGETWERLAFVRLRGLCGSQRILEETEAFAKKFSFRKHLDFTLLEDLKHLRSKIQGHYWARSQNGAIDLKLGVGGIRDVELFTHAMQVIHGGRDSLLQMKGTSAALETLAQKSLLPKDEAQFLATHYWNLRRLENYVQALQDEQTHLIKPHESHPEFVRLSLQTLNADMQRCEAIVKDLLGEFPTQINLNKELKSEGFLETEIQDIWSEIISQTALSRNKERDENSRKAFLLDFLQTLKKQKGDTRKGLLLLKDFIQNTRAKASFFSLLLREKKLQQDLAWLFGHSPYLSRIICNRPELLDSFVYRAQDRLSSDLSILLEELAEKRLLSEVINGSEYLKSHDLKALVTHLSSTADQIVLELLKSLLIEYPSQIKILTLGKWGGCEMGLRSDLDFVFVIPDAGSDNDFKLARRLITRLTEPHRGGRIYSIDMRLRPSGQAGPLVIKESELQEHLQKNAAAWERQAYLKARWLGDTQVSSLQGLFINKGLTESDLTELERIRQQLLDRQSLNIKFSEGGLVDIELAAQTSVLMQRKAPSATGTLDLIETCWQDKGIQLQKHYIRMRQIEQMLQLIASESLSTITPNSESFQNLAVSLQKDPIDLQNELRQLFADSTSLLKELDPRRIPL